MLSIFQTMLGAGYANLESFRADVIAGLFTRPMFTGTSEWGWLPAEVRLLAALRESGMPPCEVKKAVKFLHARRSRDEGLAT
jgi:hypothetical protein